jgi:hypothetical protein
VAVAQFKRIPRGGKLYEIVRSPTERREVTIVVVRACAGMVMSASAGELNVARAHLPCIGKIMDFVGSHG